MQSPLATLTMEEGLPLVRAALPTLQVGVARYSAPCAIGAMMTLQERKALAKDWDGFRIASLAENGCVSIPLEQLDDFKRLQTAFDFEGYEHVEAVLAELEAKYLPQAAQGEM